VSKTDRGCSARGARLSDSSRFLSADVSLRSAIDARVDAAWDPSGFCPRSMLLSVLLFSSASPIALAPSPSIELELRSMLVSVELNLSASPIASAPSSPIELPPRWMLFSVQLTVSASPIELSVEDDVRQCAVDLERLADRAGPNVADRVAAEAERTKVDRRAAPAHPA
jgi:hypothetical protein